MLFQYKNCIDCTRLVNFKFANNLIELIFIIKCKEAPLITSVEQTSENTVLVKWNVDNNYEITRYRIMFKDMSNLVKEWPSKQTN